jgi:hypothetical protein
MCRHAEFSNTACVGVSAKAPPCGLSVCRLFRHGSVALSSAAHLKRGLLCACLGIGSNGVH